MTCKEKFIKDHPDYSKKQLGSVFDNDCPSDYCIADDPFDEYGNLVCYEDCKSCWDREIPETPETPETEPCEPNEENNDELTKLRNALSSENLRANRLANELAEKSIRVADLEQRNKNQCDLIEKKTAELAISHARIGELTGDLDAKDNDIKILEGKVAELGKKLTEHAEGKIAEAFCSTSSSCALSADDIRHAIALSMFNKYHTLLDVVFSSDEALKLTVMWKD